MYLQGLAICKSWNLCHPWKKLYDCNGEQSTMDCFWANSVAYCCFHKPYWFKTLYMYVKEPTLVMTLSTCSHLEIIYLIADLEPTTTWRTILNVLHVTQKAIAATKTTHYTYVTNHHTKTTHLYKLYVTNHHTKSTHLYSLCAPTWLAWIKYKFQASS